jgi:HK97 family phage prohead protease|tara:strand:- start:2040 stop:2708 length:669 start_codon:yes stop_codon:yes gene_type:complete
MSEEHLEIVNDILDLECDYKELDTDDDGTFEGYASVFNNKDLGNDVIKQGAFSESIKGKKPKQIKLLYQHKTDEPIGVIDSLVEDTRGLKIKGRLAMGTQKGKEVFELMKMGALDSMSIGYRLSPDDYKYSDKLKKRTITNLDLMEISMVTFPMNPKAKITKVKLAEMNVREIEHYLRDVGLMSSSVAKQSANVLYKSFNHEVDEQRDVVDSIKHLIETIKH